MRLVLASGQTREQVERWDGADALAALSILDEQESFCRIIDCHLSRIRQFFGENPEDWHKNSLYSDMPNGMTEEEENALWLNWADMCNGERDTS